MKTMFNGTWSPPAVTRLLTACLMGCVMLTSPTLAAERVPASTAVTRVVAADTATEWHALTAQQREVLKPLAHQWRYMDDPSRDKWRNVANRYGSLPPAEQRRLQQRMARWSDLPPQERGEARLRFQQSRQLSAHERQRKWEAYQALPPETREALSRRARRQAHPVELPHDMSGPREAQQMYTTRQRREQSQSHQKSNMVPGAPESARPAPMVVAPVVIKAGPGATTRLLTQPAAPPGHQQAGLPKINSTGSFVDPVTMLPRKGAQGAAITPVPEQGRAHQR